MDTPSTPAKSNNQQLPTLSPGTQEFLKRHNLDQRLLDSDDDDDDSFDPALLASASRNALANSKITTDSNNLKESSNRDLKDISNKDLSNRPTANLPRRATPPDFKRSSPLSASVIANSNVKPTNIENKTPANFHTLTRKDVPSSQQRPLRLLPETPNIPSSSTSQNPRTATSTVRRRRPAAGTQRPDKKWTPAMLQMLQGGHDEEDFDSLEGSDGGAYQSTSYNTPESAISGYSPENNRETKERPMLGRSFPSTSSYSASENSVRNTPPSLTRSTHNLKERDSDEEERHRAALEERRRKDEEDEEQRERERQQELEREKERERERERQEKEDRAKKEVEEQRERERQQQEEQQKRQQEEQLLRQQQQQQMEEEQRRRQQASAPPLTDAIVPLQPPSYVPPQQMAWPQPNPYLGMRPPSYISVNGVPYMRLDELGKGGSSKVYRVLSSQNELHAIKRVRLDKCDPETVTGYLNEISLLQRLRGNDRIIKLWDWERTGGKLVMRMECGEIDFARLLYEQQGKRLNMNFVGMYWEQMLRAVHAIHEEAIVHSDLKPANFVLVKGSLKLIDFGIAKAIPNDTTNIHRDSQVGTINYMSPEAITNPSGLGNKRGLKLGRPSDVWSLGCILYQMIYSHPPFYHYQNIHKKLSAIPDPNVVIDFPTYSIPVEPPQRTASGTYEPVHRQDLAVKVDQDVLKTMKSCLNRDARKRMTIPELLDSDEFLQPKQSTQSPNGKANTLSINHAQMNQLVKQVIQFGKSQSNNPSVLKPETVSGVTQALWKTLGDAQN
ncbi:kinase-like protein [Wallemia mellicola]|nr:kinase-like protein [Wallemia mellicola]